MTSLRLLPLCLVAVVGCVSAGTHDELKQKYDRAQGSLAERNIELRSLGQALTDAQDELKGLHSAHATATAKLDELGRRRAAQDRTMAQKDAEVATLQQQLASLVHDRSQLASTTKQLTDALRQLSERKAQADARIAEFRGLLSRFKDLIDAGQLKIRLVDGRMVLALPTDVLFASGSADLSGEGQQAVTKVASVLAGMTERRFQVEGHTDDVPIRTSRFPSNWELSAARALGVVKAFCAAGMDCHALSAAAFGAHHPAVANDSDEGRAQNRRIEVVLLPDLAMLPGFEELKTIVEAH